MHLLHSKNRFQKNGRPIALADNVTSYLPKELWKDIPDFEGLYQLSNYGRVRSLSRFVYSETRVETFRQGRIIKLRFTTDARNKKSPTPSLDIQMQLHKDGLRYHFSVARYVYYLFVEKFDLSDHTYIVRRKDNDKLNCFYLNLQLDSISKVAKEGFAAGKRTSKFQERSKLVNQYSLEGKFIKTFSSSKQAAEATGVVYEYINDAARRKVRTTGNSYWRYGKPKSRINVSKFKSRLQNANRVKRKRIQQLTLKGKPVKIFNSVTEAAKEMKQASCSNISSVCKGKSHSLKGFKWRYLD